MIEKLNNMVVNGEIRKIILFIAIFVLLVITILIIEKTKSWKRGLSEIILALLCCSAIVYRILFVPNLDYKLIQSKEYILSANEYRSIVKVLDEEETGECNILVRSLTGEFSKLNVVVDINYIVDNSNLGEKEIVIEKYITDEPSEWGIKYSKEKYVVKYIKNRSEIL